MGRSQTLVTGPRGLREGWLVEREARRTKQTKETSLQGACAGKHWSGQRASHAGPGQHRKQGSREYNESRCCPVEQTKYRGPETQGAKKGRHLLEAGGIRVVLARQDGMFCAVEWWYRQNAADLQTALCRMQCRNGLQGARHQHQ